MRLNIQRMKAAMADSGVTREQLAGALPRASDRAKQDALATTKINNWLAGREQPRPRAADIQAIAQTLGVEVGHIARYTSQFKWARSSQQKTGLVLDLIRGRSVIEAQNLLRFSPKRAAMLVSKALDAAAKDAEDNQAAPERLIIAEAKVDRGMVIRRFQPKDRGRAHPIRKPTCHITVTVEEEL